MLRDRVFQEVRAKRNLSYAPDAFLRNQGANIGGIYVTAVDANQSVNVMLDEIARLQRVPIDDQDIQSWWPDRPSYDIGRKPTKPMPASWPIRTAGRGWRKLGFIEKLSAVTPRTSNE